MAVWLYAAVCAVCAVCARAAQAEGATRSARPSAELIVCRLLVDDDDERKVRLHLAHNKRFDFCEHLVPGISPSL